MNSDAHGWAQLRMKRRIAVSIALFSVFGFAEGATVPSFRNDVQPILYKMGCNTGACHGAAIGRGGFKLSLYGSDAAADYRAIVHELEGRRINQSRPQQSLLLLKSTEQIGHEGGEALLLDGEGAERLREWIRSGANRISRRRLKQINVVPSRFVVEKPNEVISFKTVAYFEDGSVEDVTRWTVFKPDDPAAVEVDPKTATAKVLRRGRHILTARYADRVVPLEILVPISEKKIDLSHAPRKNFIDEEILKTLSVLRIPASTQSDDATFLRRLSLDLTGTLPSPDEVRAFLADKRPDKRDRLIEKLLRSEKFIDYWTFQFAKLLRIRSQPKDTTGAFTYHTWLRKQISERRPYNELARELLTATGDSHEYGPANFYRTVGDARSQAEFVSELFLGVRLRCANCHNHPLDKWTQDDYHGLSAVFAKIERGRVIRAGTRGEVIHPRTGEPAVPRIPGVRFLPESEDGRNDFSKWLTDDTNPFFARAAVNRLWKVMMGRGLVEPTDDLRETNPATHPELLKTLADDFISHKYDIRHTLKRIAQSATYQRSTITLPNNRADNRFYSHALSRPLEPEVLADAMANVTGVWDRYPDQPAETHAVTLFDPKIKSTALDILGRCSREESCETPAGSSGGLSLKLHLINGPLVNRKINDSKGRLKKLLSSGKSEWEIIEEFSLRALGRSPSEKESRYWHRQIEKTTGEKDRNELMEDFLWSLLNCREFVTNH
ncbi:MAG: DUF1553 domain-containing protein [Planctomycetes bacterium]|nr:DUF1553 domain-containing protein [Planctomycetota bacterium]